MIERPTLAALCAFALAGLATSADAGVITATDFDDLTYGSTNPVPMTLEDFTKSDGTDNGDLENVVRLHTDARGQDIYTYFHFVTAEVDDVSEFATDFSVLGFNGVAGWWFDLAGQEGGRGDSSDFVITQDADGSLDWQVATKDPDGTSWFDNDDGMLFFFQSTYAPSLGVYTLTNGGVAEGISYAPVPLPPAALTGLGLLGGLLVLRRLRRRRPS